MCILCFRWIPVKPCPSPSHALKQNFLMELWNLAVCFKSWICWNKRLSEFLVVTTKNSSGLTHSYLAILETFSGKDLLSIIFYFVCLSHTSWSITYDLLFHETAIKFFKVHPWQHLLIGRATWLSKLTWDQWWARANAWKQRLSMQNALVAQWRCLTIVCQKHQTFERISQLIVLKLSIDYVSWTVKETLQKCSFFWNEKNEKTFFSK